MRLLKVTLNNFLSFSSASLPLANRGLVLIRGENNDSSTADSNGAGKSALFEAIIWSLWGKTSRGISGDEVVSRYHGRDCRVRVDFEDELGNRYYVTRYRKHRKYVNRLILESNGIDLSGTSVQATQTMLDEILGMNYETASATIAVGQGLTTRFAQATDADKKRVMDGILQLDELSSCLSLTKSLIKQGESDVASLDKSLSSVATRIIECRRTSSQLEEAREKFVAGKSIRLRDKQGKIKKLIMQSVDSTSLAQQRTGLENQLSVLLKKRETYSNALARRDEWENVYTRASEKCSETQGKLSTILSEIRVLETKIARINKGLVIGQTCDTCGGDVTEVGKDHLVKCANDNLAEKKVIEVTLRESVEQLSFQRDNAQKEMKNASKESKIANLVEVQISDMRRKIDTAKALEEAQARIDEQVLSLQKEMKVIEAEVFPSQELLDTSSARLVSLEGDASKLTIQLQGSKETLPYYEFWAHAFSDKGIKSYLLDLAVPHLTRFAQEYAKILCDSRILFETQKELKSGKVSESMTVRAINAQGEDVYNGASGGEKQRADLCVLFALQDFMEARARGKFNIILLDEIFVNLDSSGVERVVRLLQHISKKYESVFLISHDENLKDYFSNVITIEKRNGVSRVVNA